MDALPINSLLSFIDKAWEEDILPTMCEFIKIPNQSPHYDPDWAINGFQEQAFELFYHWASRQPIRGLKVTKHTAEGRTPLLLIHIPGTLPDAPRALLYGHFDKQPPVTGWDDDLGPYTPVIKNDKLYGRGACDDGYAIFSALNAFVALQQHAIPHGPAVVLIEGSEESGSFDLPYYMDTLSDQLGDPDLVVCLDSGCGNYEQLWTTTSLRGVVSANLHIQTLTESIHSGRGSGAAPSVFLILQQLLARLQNEHGDVTLPALQAHIPEQAQHHVAGCAKHLGESFADAYPWHGNTQASHADPETLLTNVAWLPQLSITGIDGLPSVENAGNVTIPALTVKLSMRIPPNCDPNMAAEAMQTTLTENPPYNASIRFECDATGAGWSAKPIPSWLSDSMEEGSQACFQKECVYYGEGGSIPFMHSLTKQFPNANFFITGVVGPKANAHGPNEFLHIPMVKRLTTCIAVTLARMAETKTSNT